MYVGKLQSFTNLTEGHNTGDDFPIKTRDSQGSGEQSGRYFIYPDGQKGFHSHGCTPRAGW